MTTSSHTKKKLGTTGKAKKLNSKPKKDKTSSTVNSAVNKALPASPEGHKMDDFIIKPFGKADKKQGTASKTNKQNIKTNKSNSKIKSSKAHSTNNRREHEILHVSPEGHKIDDSLITNNLVSAFTYGDLLMKMSENISHQLFSSVNSMVTDNLEVSKDFFKCTTLTDMLSLQEKLFSTNCQLMMNNMNNILSSVMSYHDNLDQYTYHKNDAYQKSGGLGNMFMGNFKL